MQKHKNIFRWLLDKLKEFASNLKKYYKTIGSSYYEGATALKEQVGDTVKYMDSIVKLFDQAAVQAVENYQKTAAAEAQKNTAEDGGVQVQYKVREEFDTELRDWFENTTHEERKVSGKRFLVGTTSKSLKSIGVKDYKIYIGGAKIDKILTDNTSMTLDTIADAVMLLDSPILIMKSLTVENSIVLFGEAYTSGKKPVMISVLLSPKTSSGEILDYAVITSAYGRTKNNLQNMINKAKIYYVNEQKNRTDKWLKALGLQLPSALTKYGPTDTIEYSDLIVKNESARAMDLDVDAPTESVASTVQFSERMTYAEIQAVQAVGRKSVNSFTSADIKATKRFAERYWHEMGTKSPFFRAWFGDWRVNDQEKVQIANRKSDTRGIQQNADTGWDIQVSGQVFAESKHFAKKNKSAMPYLPYINDIVKKAVLLDSYGIDFEKAKSQNSLLMHSLYAVADIGYGPELLKLYVEEMNDPNSSDTAKRAYQLQNIEKASAVNGGVQGNTPSSLANTTNAIRTVADLFAAVKQKDADFKPNAASTVVNADGTPKVVYHGSADQFNIFSYGHIGSASGVSILGDGFYFCDKKRLAKNYGENVYECYLQMKKPYQATAADAYKLNTKKLQNQGYDGVILESPSGKIYMVFDNTQIKSATDNIGTFDERNPDIQYQQRTNTLTDRDVLAVAASEVDAGKWTAGEKEALGIFSKRLEALEDLQTQRTELGRIYYEQQFGPGGDRQAAAKTLNRMHVLDEQISRAANEVLDVEHKEVLRKVLKKARSVVEQQNREQFQASVHERENFS